MAGVNCITELWRIAEERGNLTNEELEKFSRVAEEGSAISGLADMLDGIGCLVNDDATKTSKVGNFLNGSDTATLLFSIADYLRTLGDRAYIASEADYELRRRLKAESAR